MHGGLLSSAAQPTISLAHRCRTGGGGAFFQKEDRRRSGSCAVVIVEHSTEALAPMHRLRWRDDRSGPQKLVCEALMIAFSMVVRHEVANRVLDEACPKKI